ncbi:unnamed protein product [Calypogeia fissa]
MPTLGLKVWDSLIDSHDWASLQEMIPKCADHEDVYTWASRALSREDGDHSYSHLSEIESNQLTRLSKFFKIWFAPTDRPQLPFEVFDSLHAFKKDICANALHWLSQKRDTLLWDKDNSWAAYEEQAMGEYKAWKLDRKPKAIRAYLPNIIEALKSFRNFTEEDATLVAKEHANWVDTSDEELEDTDFEDLLMEANDNNEDEQHLDEDPNVDEDEEFQDPQDPVCADQNPPVVATNGPTTASDAPPLITLTTSHLLRCCLGMARLGALSYHNRLMGEFRDCSLQLPHRCKVLPLQRGQRGHSRTTSSL